jgi:hypothetical protein
VISVTVTWIDNVKEDYSCEDIRYEAAGMWLTQRQPSSEPKRFIPYHNVRIFVVYN